MANIEVLDRVFSKYDLEENEIEYLKSIILPIYNHEEFQKRCTNEFLHHGDVLLGEHILDDTLVTYFMCKKKNDIDIPLALKIAMLHDLYTISWQNRNIKHNSFFHLHGFTHPIEASINSLTWFPELFSDDDAYKLLDGIIHHMYPFPVVMYKNYKTNELELLNYNLTKDIDKKYLKMIEEISKRNKIGVLSFSRSKTKEGRIMAKADKRNSLKELNHFEDFKALVTGKNKKIK